MIKVNYEGTYCNLSIDRPAKGIVIVKFSGSDIGEFEDIPFQELSKDLAKNEIELFIDARDVRGASVEVSGDWAFWLQKNKMNLKSINMLTGSRFIQLTADFVKRFADLGESMKIFKDPDDFDNSLAKVILDAKKINN